MKPQLVCAKILVKKSPIHHYGVFAEQMIEKGEIIEECYTLFSSAGIELELEDFYFNADDLSALPLGCGCIYNHSKQPNANYLIDSERSLMVFTANQQIKKGEEIFITYGDDWFGSRRMEPSPVPASSSLKLRKISRFAQFLMRFATVLAALLIFIALTRVFLT